MSPPDGSLLTPALVREAADGDPHALQQLLAAVTPVVQARVARALLRRGGRTRDIRDDVADVTQEVFLGLFADGARVLRAWDPERGLSLLNFVGLVAERRVADLLRPQERSAWMKGATDGWDDATPDAERAPPDAEALSRITLERLLERLERALEPRAIDMFQRIYVREQPVEQICRELAMSADAVYQWKHRLGRLARAALATLKDDEASAVRALAGVRTGRENRS